MKPVTISRRLAEEVDELRFSTPVTHVYNPLRYARRNAEAYLRRYARTGCEAILLGMNPGPFGMAQTGVPFGEVEIVRRWLGIDGAVEKPEHEHPKRPILGMACRRSEVSGSRLWGWAEKRFGTADRFFDRFFVWNYCPLLFMEDSGRNRTPDKLPKEEREPLERICDRALSEIVESLRPARVIGIGRFAERRARRVLPETLPVDTILHPSPASPLANRGWAPQAEAQLRSLGIHI
ncbi:MAG TPA: single-stranded DNA-binding protein [Planctomycetes bacterium]|nr:single-stranded DNA-binding protein [Planctomycetota bacterium]